MNSPTELDIATRPSCSSQGIRRVRRDFQGEFRGKPYTVPLLGFWECTACGELVFDRNAVRQIQAVSPAYRSHRGSKKPGAPN